MTLRRASLLLFTACCTLLRPGASRAQGPENIAAIPVDRLSEAWWADRHADVLRQAKAHPDTELLLVGDSITQNYEKSKLPDENFEPIWQEFYGRRKALNLGYSGDTTANVLWRLDHGEVDGLHPKAVVLLIGTNNTGSHDQTAQQTQVGIDAVIADLEQRFPSARILLLPILPSGISAQKSARDAAVNSYLAHVYGENPRVAYLDISSVFLRRGSVDSSLFYDPRLPGRPGALHPDSVGQRRLAEAIEPTLAGLLGGPPVLPLAAMVDVTTALIPVAKLEQDSYDWFARHHAALLAKDTIAPEVVLLGDSITHFWAGPPYAAQQRGPDAWRLAFGDRATLNLGFGWDRTQNVLWRIQQGEIDGLHPAYFVVNIGTNNLTGTDHARASSPEEVAAGIEAICAELRRRAPASHIVLMGIFPRGRRSTDSLRAPIGRVNAILAHRYADTPGVSYIDLGAQFLTADGELPPALMPDGTHPSESGYRIWAEALAARWKSQAHP